MLKELIKNIRAVPHNVWWGVLWILIGITGFILVETGHGIQIYSCNNSNIPSVNGTYPTKYINPSDNSDIWGYIDAQNQPH